MFVVASLLPDFSKFDFSDYVAYGNDIPSSVLLKYFCRLLAFVLPAFVASYFCLKAREVAK